MKNNFEQDVAIDPANLALEWLRQATLVHKYAELSARAKDTLTRAKDNLEVVKAQVDGRIRAIPSDKKPTEAAISGMVLQSEEYLRANEEYLQAKLTADLVQSACIALDHKKAALENLVRLMGQNYFAGPKEPQDLGDAWGKRLQDVCIDLQVDIDQRAKDRMARRAQPTEAELAAMPQEEFRRTTRRGA